PGDQSEQARQVPQEAQSDERPPEPVDAGRRDGETVLDMPDFERLALERFAVSGERTEGRVDVGSEVVVRTPASNASETPDDRTERRATDGKKAPLTQAMAKIDPSEMPDEGSVPPEPRSSVGGERLDEGGLVQRFADKARGLLREALGSPEGARIPEPIVEQLPEAEAIARVREKVELAL